jgi:hypothetical protein
MPWYPQIYIFGHLTAVERASYTELATYLPAGAIVGTSVNSGAVELYTGHPTIRPGSWSEVELDRFLQALALQNHVLYFLEDGSEMQALRQRLPARISLRKVGQLTLPWFEGGSQWPERQATLYAVQQ